MAENPWENLGAMFNPLQKQLGDNLTKVADLIAERNILETEFQKGVEGLKTVMSENKELKAFLGLGDGDPKKIDQPPAPAPAKKDKAPPPSRSSSTPPPSRSSSASSTVSTSTLGRSTSTSFTGSTPPPSRSSSTSSLNRADSDKAKVAQPLGRSSSTSSAASTLSRASSAPPKAPAPAQSQTPSVSSQVSSLFRRASSTGSSSSDSIQNKPSTSSQKSDGLSGNSNKSSASFIKRVGSFGSLVSSSLGSVSSKNSSKSQPNKDAPLRAASTSSSRASSIAPSRTPSRTPPRTPPKDNLRKEGGKKLSILAKVSSGLSKCSSSLSNLALHYEVSKNEETLVEGRVPLRLPRSSSFPGPGAIKSGLGRSTSRLRRGASRLGEALSSSVSQAKEGLGDFRRESSSVGDSLRGARATLRSLGDFGGVSIFPSSSPSPRSWVNLSSVRSSSNCGQDFKNALSGFGGLVGEAGSQTRDWASNFRISASELSLRAWVR
jgi:hypothetical protein